MPEKSGRREDSTYALLLCLIVFAMAVWQIRNYQSELDKQEITIPGDPPIPALSFNVRDPAEQPAVIIVHGFSASKEMMQTLGLEVAKMGVAVYLFDFPGHGASVAPFRFYEGDSEEALARNTPDFPGRELVTYLERVYDYVRGQHGGNSARIALIGHSMGSGVVTRFAMEHPEIKAVVSISPPFPGEVSQSQPPNLLLLVGQWDISQSVAGVREALAAAIGDHAELGTTYGDFNQGTARRAVLLPRLDHIAIIFSPASMVEINNWLARSLPVLYAVPTGIIRLLWLLAGTLAAVVAALLLVSPLHHLASGLLGVANAQEQEAADATARLGQRPARAGNKVRAEPWRISVGDALGYLILFAVASSLTVLFLNVRTPFTFLRLLIGDYLTSYFFIAGVLMYAIARLTRNDIPLLPRRDTQGVSLQANLVPRMSQSGLSSLVVAIAVFVVFVLTTGLLATYTWIRFVPSAARWSRLIPVFVLSLPFFVVDETMFRAFQESSLVGAGVMSLLGKAIVLASLAAGALLSPRHTVVLLMLPLMLIFFLLLQLFSLRMYHVTRSTVATATFNALLVAWIMVAVFPIT